MTPRDIIQQFGLETSTNAHDFLIAADCAWEEGLEEFAHWLHESYRQLMGEIKLPPFGYADGGVSGAGPTLQECGYGSHYRHTPGAGYGEGVGYGSGDVLSNGSGYGNGPFHGPGAYGRGEGDGSGSGAGPGYAGRENDLLGLGEGEWAGVAYGLNSPLGHGHGGSMVEFRKLAQPL